jgi:hypothetical protein
MEQTKANSKTMNVLMERILPIPKSRAQKATMNGIVSLRRIPPIRPATLPPYGRNATHYQRHRHGCEAELSGFQAGVNGARAKLSG